MKKLLFLTFLFTFLAGCTNTLPAKPDSGIEGQVSIGPACPVLQTGVSCPDKPYQATLSVYNLDGRRIARFQTDPAGRFRVLLDPGEYLLKPESSNAMQHAPELSFSVVFGKFTRLTITYDSGIR